ncbi:hypothetical protein A6A06_07305 [Streptomyces sp. CB02923]|nr:hypothetical protein A6A06_07305 [Streptomyces sp. CB02923]
MVQRNADLYARACDFGLGYGALVTRIAAEYAACYAPRWDRTWSRKRADTGATEHSCPLASASR